MSESVQYPMFQESPLDPPVLLRQLRDREPVSRITLWNGRPAWLVTRYSDARQALTDPRLSSSAADPNFPSMNPSRVIPNSPNGLVRTEGRRHAEIRRMVASMFTVRAAEEWRPVSQRIVDEQVAVLLDGGQPADIIARFALPVPLRLICHILGVPPEDIDRVGDTGQLMITRAYDSSRPAGQRAQDYLEDLVRRKEEAPGDDLIGQLVREQFRPGHIAHDELVALARNLLFAGHTTTASSIGLGVFSLLEQPGRFRALRDDPAMVAPTVEEFLRFQTIVSDGAPRVATEDLTIAGTPIRVGEAVVISLTSANRDETAFADPDSLDLRRPDARRHMAFGWGVHRCLGQHLARMEMQTAFATLAREVPTLRIVEPTEEVHYGHRERHLSNVRELAVAW